jgi:3-deoxy-manno-octulosonate cytidylyltransferase (CMP-KDO synthetase)
MILGLIPARLNSSRLPNKALLKIDGLPMIIHVLKRSKLSSHLNRLIVCTDSEEIFNTVQRYGGECIYTKSNHDNGTERIAEVAKKIKCKQIIDIQCDEVLLNPKNIDRLIIFHKKNFYFDIVVPYSKVLEKTDKNLVKIVSNKYNKILYMSRENVPFSFKKKNPFYSRHLDIISFKPKALIKLAHLKKSFNEKIEGIELLRALDNNLNVGTFFINTKSFSVNTKIDYIKAKKYLKFCTIRKKY